MRFKTKIKFWMHKRYFDAGRGLLDYFKYIIAFYGLASQNIINTIFIGIIWGIFCYIIGYFYIKRKFLDVVNEINNMFNPLAREIRRKL